MLARDAGLLLDMNIHELLMTGILSSIVGKIHESWSSASDLGHTQVSYITIVESAGSY